MHSALQNSLQDTIDSDKLSVFPGRSVWTITDANVERYDASLVPNAYDAQLRVNSGDDVDLVVVQFPGANDQARSEGTVLATTDFAADESGAGVVEIANLGGQEVELADLRVDVVNQFGYRFAGSCGRGECPSRGVGPKRLSWCRAMRAAAISPRRLLRGRI